MSYGIGKLGDWPTVINKVHESCYRSYRVLDIVERLIEDGAPATTIKKIIGEYRDLPGKEDVRD